MPVMDDLRAIAERTDRELDAVGDHVELEDSYHLESWSLIKKVVRDVTSAAVGRLSK